MPLKFLSAMPIDPLRTNSFIDSCAFDPKYHPEDQAAEELLNLNRRDNPFLIIAHSTEKEIDHPRTPSTVKAEARGMIRSVNVQLTPPEQQRLHQIEQVLAGNGEIENIRQDARHIFECQKYGSYFITTDERILKRKNALLQLCGVSILKTSEFLPMVKGRA